MKKYTVKASAGQKLVLFGALVSKPPLADILPATTSPIVDPARRHFAAAQAVAAGTAVSDLPTLDRSRCRCLRRRLRADGLADEAFILRTANAFCASERITFMEVTMSFTSAAVVCVGTELLLGDIVNTNFAHIARELADLGVPLYRESCVGDNPDRLRSTLESALAESELVITTGGLGPTGDDLTKETLAAIFDAPLICDRAAEENIRERLRVRGVSLSANNLKQAYLPEGAIPFYNPVGTAPGFMIEKNGRVLCSLPGVPHEMRTMLERYVLPMIRARGELCIVSRSLHVCGIGESKVDEMLGDLTSGANPTVAPYCKSGETRLRLSARAGTHAEAEAMLDALQSRIMASEVGQYVYFVTHTNEDADRAAQLAAFTRLRDAGMTVAFAESITGGLCAKMISDLPGASAVLRGGAVVYATDTKSLVLGVDASVIGEHGVVSEECAAAMARGARTLFGADVAVSTTGLADASPYADGRGTEPGTVCIGIADAQGTRAVTVHFGSGHTRAYVRELAATRVMHMLARGE